MRATTKLVAACGNFTMDGDLAITALSAGHDRCEFDRRIRPQRYDAPAWSAAYPPIAAVPCRRRPRQEWAITGLVQCKKVSKIQWNKIAEIPTSGITAPW